MPGRSIRIARVAGIPIGVSPWWLAIVALLTWSLGATWFPDAVDGIAPAAAYALGLASALLLFASILLHELGHALVARRRGVEVEEIDLWLLGGVSKLRGEAHEPGDELRYALAGPAVTLAIVVVFALLAQLLPRSTVPGALVEYQLVVNGLILMFNMVPAFPLDGGRVLRALLWRRGGDPWRATAIAALCGRAFGFGLIALGAVVLAAGGFGGLWLIVIGIFLIAAAAAQATAADVQATFSGIVARDLMSTPVAVIAAGATVARAASESFVPMRHTAFPVVDAARRPLGLVRLDDVLAVPERERGRRTVGEIADRDPQLVAALDDDVVALLERPAFARVGRLVVVDDDGAPAGLLSVTDVQRALRAARLARA